MNLCETEDIPTFDLPDGPPEDFKHVDLHISDGTASLYDKSQIHVLLQKSYGH